MFEEIIAFIRSLYPEKDVVPLHEPVFAGREKEYLNSVIDSTFVSSVGQFVDRFEQMTSEITGSKYAIAAVNGTAALHMALKLAGVEPGDEVVTQPLTFVATANAITYCGAKSVFIDVDRETLGLSPDLLLSFLKKYTTKFKNECRNERTGKRIAACVPMHTFGHPCRIDEIVDICERHHITVVEDAAESLGSRYRGKHTGTFGRLGIFSFNGNKTVTCGGGGAIVTDDSRLAERARHLTTTAKVPHPYEYVHDEIGYNYRLPNLNAALACAQLEQLESIVDNKRKLAEKYAHFFQSIDVSFFSEPENARSNYWLNTLILPDHNVRNEFLETTNKAGVTTRPVWQLLNKLPIYKDCQADGLNNAQWLEDRIVNIPSSVLTQ